MSGKYVPAARWVALRVIGGILAYGFLAGFVGLIGMQIHHWLRDGQWTHIGVSDGLYSTLTSCCVHEDAGDAGWLTAFARWLDQPTDWLGWHKVLGVLPASIGLFLFSILGNFLYVYGGDRIDAGRSLESDDD